VDTGFIDISSSGLRTLLHKRQGPAVPPDSSIRAVLGEDVLRLIEARGLYH